MTDTRITLQLQKDKTFVEFGIFRSKMVSIALTRIFAENQSIQDFFKAGDKLMKRGYDVAVGDSKVERDFVTEMNTSSEVAVGAKLLWSFFVSTPVDDYKPYKPYKPYGAIAVTDGPVKRMYFVAETKVSLSTLQLKGIESTKMECAVMLFVSLSEKDKGEVDVVTDYCEFMQLVVG